MPARPGAWAAHLVGKWNMLWWKEHVVFCHVWRQYVLLTMYVCNWKCNMLVRCYDKYFDVMFASALLNLQCRPRVLKLVTCVSARGPIRPAEFWYVPLSSQPLLGARLQCATQQQLTCCSLPLVGSLSHRQVLCRFSCHTTTIPSHLWPKTLAS